MTFQSLTMPRYAWALARPWVNGRRGLILAGIGVTGAGLALGWHWLAALGVTPFLVSLAPCLAMCALGLCMPRMMGKSCDRQGTTTSMPATPDGAPETLTSPPAKERI